MYKFTSKHKAPTTVYYWIAQITKLQKHKANLSRKASVREQANAEADSESNRIESTDKVQAHIYGKVNDSPSNI